MPQLCGLSSVSANTDATPGVDRVAAGLQDAHPDLGGEVVAGRHDPVVALDDRPGREAAARESAARVDRHAVQPLVAMPRSANRRRTFSVTCDTVFW